MASYTGGKAHYSNNGLEDFLSAKMSPPGATTTRSRTFLRFQVRRQVSSKIEVEGGPAGVQLEYRKGYTSLDINGPLHEQEKSHEVLPSLGPKDVCLQTAMGYGAPAATQVTFAVHAAPSNAPRKPTDTSVIGSVNPELKDKPLVRYSFAFDLPRDKITLEEQPDGTRKASFELGVVAYDVQGRVLNSLDEKRSVTLKADAVAGFLQKPFVVPMEIDLPPGALSVRAGVLDEPSQAMGVVEIPRRIVK